MALLMNQCRINGKEYLLKSNCIRVALLLEFITYLILCLPYCIFCIIWRNQDLVTKWCSNNKSTVCTRTFRTYWNNKYCYIMNEYRGVWDSMHLFKASYHTFCVCIKPGPGCPSAYVVVFLCSMIWGQRSLVDLVIDIVWFVDNHSLKFFW